MTALVPAATATGSPALNITIFVVFVVVIILRGIPSDTNDFRNRYFCISCT